jgi:uncharacterized protein YjbJ (UPF0337 family)
MPCQEHAMGANNDQIKGRIKEVKGKIRETAGKVVDNRTLQVKGKVQGFVGAAEAMFGDVKQAVKDSLKKRRMTA